MPWVAKGDMFNENFLMAIATIGALCSLHRCPDCRCRCYSSPESWHFDETLKKFDCILVFKQGRIVEQGSFEELMKNKEYFYSLKNKGCI